MIEADGLVVVCAAGGGRERRALDRVGLRCGAGEITGLLGANGAGKTTLLRVIGGLIRPSAGQCRVAGIDVVRHPDESRRHVGMLGEEGGPASTQSPLWHLAFHAGLLGQRRRRAFEAAARSLAEIGLRHRAGDRSASLSRGQRARVALARVFLAGPRVLLLDEPTAGLDLRAGAWMRERILRSREEGLAVVIASHDPGELERLADRIVLLRAGRVALEGSPAQVRGGAGSLEEACLRLMGDSS